MVDNQPKNLRKPGETDEDLLNRLFAERGIKIKTQEEHSNEVDRLANILESLEPVEKRLDEVFDAPIEDRKKILEKILDEELGKDTGN